jgi:hypothetical protein
MSDTSKHEVAQTENGVPLKRGKRGTCARHCKRFWWVHLIIFIVIAVVLLVVTFLVIVPKIGQDKVNASTLEIQGVNVLDTTSKSFTMQINSTITTDGAVGAEIDGFEGDMYLEDVPSHTPFASLSFPNTNGNKHQQVNISQEIQIKDMDAFTTFNTWFVTNDTLDVTISGKTKFKAHGLNRKYNINFKKTLTIKGLNKFDGTKVTSGTISTKKDVKYNFVGKTDIPNQSDFTLDIGNVTFTNFADDENVGSLFINNLLLVPGSNVLDIQGNIDQTKTLTLLTSKKYCKTGIIPFQLLGKSVDNHGENLSYFADALASYNQTVNIDIGSIVEKSLGFKPGC